MDYPAPAPSFQQMNISDEPPEQKIRKKCVMNFKRQLRRRIFILSWIWKYDKYAAIGDVIAGITLGLYLVPEYIACASLAGLPSQYGLYSAFVGSLIYVIFGTIKEVSIGPTASLALLTFQYTSDKPQEYVAVLTFLSGCVVLLVVFLGLELIINFISLPITHAFATATLLNVIGSQMKHLLGIEYSSRGLASTLYNLVIRIKETKLWDSILGLCCCIFLILFRLLKNVNIESRTTSGKTYKTVLSNLCDASNILILVITSFVAYWTIGTAPFHLSDEVKTGIPNFNWPSFKIEHQNRTIEFIEICTDLGSGLVVLPLTVILLNISIARKFSSGTILDVSQEMFTLGICNIIGSCFNSMPISGGLSRSFVSHSNGVKTPLVSIYSAALILLALTLLTPCFQFIPKAAVASILIISSVRMLDFKLPLRLWRNSTRDFWTWLACIIVCLALGIPTGLFFGVGLNMLQLLYIWARPKTRSETVEVHNMKYIRISSNIGLFFPGIVHLREMVNSEMIKTEFKFPVVIDCVKFIGLDYTAAQGISDLATELNNQNQVLVLQNLNENLKELITSENVVICGREHVLKDVITNIYVRNFSRIDNRC